jgi:TetR/AcrR family transcriptional regulator, lmrAB and yxaGH operons repressor
MWLYEIELLHPASPTFESPRSLQKYIDQSLYVIYDMIMRAKLATRDRFIDTAAGLFMRQGYHATGLAQIIAESGAPKGSLYFHFPGGKEALAEAAVARAGEVFARSIDAVLAAAPRPVDALSSLCDLLARWMETSGFHEGCPITNACLELAPGNLAVTDTSHAIFSGWRAAWDRHLATAGWPAYQCPAIAATIVTALEGAFILARAARSTEPFDSVKSGLTLLLERVPA